MAIKLLPGQPGLGDVLGSSLGQSLEGLSDFYLQDKLSQRQQKQKEERSIREAERKEAQLIREAERKQQKSQLFSQLLAGGQGGQSDQQGQPGQYSQDIPGISDPSGQMAQGGQSGQGGLSRDQLLQFAAQSGYSPQEISQLERSYSSRSKEAERERSSRVKEDLQREGLRLKEEAPERKIVTEESNIIRKRAKLADQKISDYKALKKLAESGGLRSGKARQVLDRFDLGGFWQDPASDVAEKLLGDINLASMSEMTTPGKATAQMLQQISKTNPNLFMTNEGMKNTADIRIISEQIQQQVNAELNKIKSSSKGKVLPLDAIDLAYERSQPKIEKLHEKQFKIAEKILQSDQKKQVVAKLPSASGIKGKKIRNTETGKILVSDGSNWIESL